MELEISENPSKVDISYVHNYLSTHSYWAKGIPQHTVEKSVDNSMCFSVFKEGKQIGFARVITDKAIFAYLADVFIDENFRGNGYSKKLMQVIIEHPELKGIRRWMLMTWDAHGLYEQFGFSAAARPDRVMEISVKNVYQNLK